MSSQFSPYRMVSYKQSYMGLLFLQHCLQIALEQIRSESTSSLEADGLRPKVDSLISHAINNCMHGLSKLDEARIIYSQEKTSANFHQVIRQIKMYLIEIHTLIIELHNTFSLAISNEALVDLNEVNDGGSTFMERCQPHCHMQNILRNALYMINILIKPCLITNGA